MGAVRRVKAGLRRALGGDPPGDVARVAHLELAIHDITLALQALQTGVPLDTGRRIDDIEAALPAVLNVIASMGGSQRLFRRELDSLQSGVGSRVDDFERLTSAELAQLWSRFDAARAEMLFELRYGRNDHGSEPTTDPPGGFETRLVDETRVAEARQNSRVRLNLGCGHIIVEDALNVDMRELPGVDIVAKLDDLPFAPEEVDEISSTHVLEHFPEQLLVRKLLPYWTSLLRPGGRFRAVVPDWQAMLAGHAAGDISLEDLREVTFGGQEYEGDFHFTMFTPERLGSMLVDVGLTDVVFDAVARPNGKCLEFEISAVRPR